MSWTGVLTEGIRLILFAGYLVLDLWLYLQRQKRRR
jgi:hypothetical protein